MACRDFQYFIIIGTESRISIVALIIIRHTHTYTNLSCKVLLPKIQAILNAIGLLVFLCLGERKTLHIVRSWALNLMCQIRNMFYRLFSIELTHIFITYDNIAWKMNQKNDRRKIERIFYYKSNIHSVCVC